MQWLKKIFLAFTKKERIAFVVAATLTLVSLVVVIWILVLQSTKLVPTNGGTYTEGMVGQPEYVNPVTASGVTDESLVKLVYSNLYNIADSVQESADGMTWTVRLKDGLHWQDGEKLTSDDVIFTVQSIQDPNADSPLAASWQGVAVNRVSELELQFTLANPYAFFGDTLKNLYIIPKHIFANTPTANWRISDYNLKPVGSGPYQFASYDKLSDGFISSYNLQAWSGYFGNTPLIQNFDLHFFANSTDLIKSFNDGQLNGMGSIDSEDIASIDRPYDLFAWDTPSYYAVFFNQSKNLALQDPVVRQALDASVDRDALVSQVLGGNGTPQYGPIPQGAPYFTPTPETTTADFASTTLTNAGWLPGANGMRAKMIQKTSVPLVVNLTVPQIDFLVQTANLLANSWQNIGVQVNIATDTPDDVAGEVIKNRDYESLLFGNVLGPSSDLYAFWNSTQRFDPGLNLAIYDNPNVDSLISQASEEMDDASRTAEFAQAENDIVADHPAIFLYSPDYLYVTDKSVQGVSQGFLADPSDRFLQVPNWYLDTARVLK